MLAPDDRTPESTREGRYAPTVAEFLSAEWLKELDAAARTSTVLAELGGESPLVIEQRVSDSPHGEVSYHVVIDADGARVVAGRAATPHVTLSTDFATASAMHRGDTNAQQALAAGKLKIGGNVDQIVRRSDALAALDDVFAGVRSTTTGTARGGGGHR